MTKGGIYQDLVSGNTHPSTYTMLVMFLADDIQNYCAGMQKRKTCATLGLLQTFERTTWRECSSCRISGICSRPLDWLRTFQFRTRELSELRNARSREILTEDSGGAA